MSLRCAHWADLCECGRKEMGELLARVVDKGHYELVVVDAGAFTAASSGCMEMSDVIILISGEGRKAAGKEQEFMRQARSADAAFAGRLMQLASQPADKMLEEVLQRLG